VCQRRVSVAALVIAREFSDCFREIRVLSVPTMRHGVSCGSFSDGAEDFLIRNWRLIYPDGLSGRYSRKSRWISYTS
jgi:hypothetical protein